MEYWILRTLGVTVTSKCERVHGILIKWETADLVTFTEQIFNWKLCFLSAEMRRNGWFQLNIQMETFKTFEIFKNSSMNCLERSNKSWKAFS